MGIKFFLKKIFLIFEIIKITKIKGHSKIAILLKVKNKVTVPMISALILRRVLSLFFIILKLNKIRIMPIRRYPAKTFG